MRPCTGADGVLFDNGTPRGVASVLHEHSVEEARSRGWDNFSNGALLDVAERAGFQVFVTTDRNLRFQQELRNRKIAIVVLGKARWRLISKRLPEIAQAIATATPGTLVEIDIPFE